MSEDPVNVELSSADSEKSKKKQRIRNVWISFAGRIVAQVVGAAASVMLGLMILQKYQQNGAAIIQTPSVQAAASVARAAARPAGALALAVLPLDSFSPDPNDAYFAAGMTEAVIADLTSINTLRVISRTSTMRYGKPGKSVPEIGRELDVDLIVEGSIVKTGRRVRVTAQLIDARTDEHLWAGSYQRMSDDVLAIQAEIAADVSRDVERAVTRVIR